ncbi:MAG: transporter permease [Ferruginibacter sp.]|nr:transporter permease [Ferruginibacter sp.]
MPDTTDIKTEAHWDQVIQPKSDWFDLNLKEVWRYRDLLWLFVKRDFSAQYKQTILGPLWHFIQPVFTTVVFLLVFTKIANIPTDGIRPILFYMSGITIWNYFSACLSATSGTFVNNAGIFGKVYFPRLVIPLSTVISHVIKFCIQFGLLLLAMAYYGVRDHHFYFGASWLLIPLLLLMMAALGLGLGIIISSLTTKYRDFTVLIGFGVQLLMYATPVAYPLSYLKGKSYAWMIEYNPLTPIVEAFRFSLFGVGSYDAMHLMYSGLFIIIVLFAGLLVFSKVERSFMDTV